VLAAATFAKAADAAFLHDAGEEVVGNASEKLVLVLERDVPLVDPLAAVAVNPHHHHVFCCKLVEALDAVIALALHALGDDHPVLVFVPDPCKVGPWHVGRCFPDGDLVGRDETAVATRNFLGRK
jgi:hypothetical protein